MKLKFIPSSVHAPHRYLVYSLHPRFGERYLGSVWLARPKAWMNNHLPRHYPTRKAAAEALEQ